MAPATVRVATSSDIPGIERLLEWLDEYHVELLPEVFHAPDGPARPAGLLEAAVADDSQDLFVAEERARIVGVAQVKVAKSPKSPLYRPRNYAVLENMIVDAAHRSHGIGASLFEAVSAWSRERGLTHVQAVCWARNERALAFYQKIGFETVTVRLECEVAPSPLEGEGRGGGY